MEETRAEYRKTSQDPVIVIVDIEDNDLVVRVPFKNYWRDCLKALIEKGFQIYSSPEVEKAIELK